MSFLRRAGEETVLVVHNVGTVAADSGPLAVAGQRADPLFVDAGAEIVREGETWRARMPPRTTAVWRLR
jgi:hypothetical protein